MHVDLEILVIMTFDNKMYSMCSLEFDEVSLDILSNLLDTSYSQ